MKVTNSHYPFISLIIITRNVERTMQKVLDSILMQTYPKNKIEILVIDGKSTDGTLEIIKRAKQKVTVIQSPYPNDPEACRGVALQKARGEILGYIDSDNYLPHKKWLENIVLPFVEHKNIVGAQALRYAYRKEDTALNRYFALLGSGDPVGYYLKKADRLSFLERKWNLFGKIIEDNKKYYLIQFNQSQFPTLGSNAFFARKSMLLKAKSDPKHYFHIDVPWDLAGLGHDTYAIIKDEIIHDTAVSFFSFLKKRVLYMKLHYDKRAKDRRYKVFDPDKKEDIWNLLLFIFYAITLVQPIMLAVRGYKKKKDWAWFLHPLFCLAITGAYAIGIFSRFFDQKKK